MKISILSLCATVLVALQCYGTSLSINNEAPETVVSVEQVVNDMVKATQKQFWQLFPPSEDLLYIHPDGVIRPVDWNSLDWPDALKNQMYAEMKSVNFSLYPFYSLWVEEDRFTGEFVYYNSFGSPVWRSPAPVNYDPYAFAKEHFGVETISELTTQQLEFGRSSKVGLKIQLLPEIFMASYEENMIMEAQAELLDAPMAMTMSAPPPPGGETNGVSSGGGSSSGMSYPSGTLYLEPHLLSPFEDGWLDLHNTIAGQKYEIYFTYNLQYVPFSTNPASFYTAWPAKVGLQGTGGAVYWDAPLVE